jgi:uncharacterized protein (TIGR03118 family)
MVTWMRSLFPKRRRPRPAPRPARARLTLEHLEARTVLSGNVLQTNLVSDLPGVAAVTDPNLVNPWGISQGPGGPFWISDNNAGLSSLYRVPGDNNTPVSISGVGPNTSPVIIPTPVDLVDPVGTPTGTVFNTGLSTGSFMLKGVDKNNNPTSAPAIFLFATEDGTIVGWNPGVNPKGFDPAKAGTYAVILKDNSGNNFTEPDPAKQTGAVYKGLAIDTSTTGAIFKNDAASTSVIYAANFRAGKIEVYDSANTPVKLDPNAFVDPNLPTGYAPFNVQMLNGKIYVTYALQNADKHDDVGGRGHGFVDVYNPDGTGLQRLVSRGPLDSPWGLAIAPTGFAGITAPNGDPVLLVGNFKSGFIDAFDAKTGDFLTLLKDPDGEPIQIDRLWALKVGTGPKNGGDVNTVYFTAGIFNETHGLFGSLSTAAPGSPEGPAESQLVTAFVDVFQLALAQVQKDLSSGVTGSQLRTDLKALDKAFVDLIHAEARFAFDARQDAHVSTHGDNDTDDLFGRHGDHDD